MKFAHYVLTAALAVGIAQAASAAETRQLGDRMFTKENGNWTQTDPDGRSYPVDSRIITVKFRDGIDQPTKNNLHPSLGTTAQREALTGFIDVEIPAGEDVFDAIDSYMASGLIEIAEPNTIGRWTLVPDDPSYGSQYFLPIIDAETAWETTPGAPSTIIAVLDSGTEFMHEDLGFGSDAYQNIWLNPGEDAWSDPADPTTGNGIDDDGNGFIDDWKGWDFGNGDNNSAGTFFHGTSVAGVAAAKTNNATGVASVAGGWNSEGAKILIAGVGDSGPLGSILDDAILYSGALGADVIQLSLTVGQSAAIDAAIEMALNTYDMPVICSSGNDGLTTVGYPSSNLNVMAIGATNQSDLKASFSNHGPLLEISAPGSNIFTTTIGNTYAPTGGTSFSSPIVSGVVAMMRAVNPDIGQAEIRQILLDTADKVGGYDYNWNESMPGHSFELGYGRVNANAAIQAAIPVGPLELKSGFEAPPPPPPE